MAKRPGIWFGIVARTQEVIIGTEHGVTKGKTVTRLFDNEKWNAQQTMRVRGTPWEPVPGKIDRRVFVAIDSRGVGVQAIDVDEADHEHQDGTGYAEPLVQFRGRPGKLHASRKGIDEYGPTEGCPACISVTRRGTATGRTGMQHNDKCRESVMTAMRDDPQYR